MGAAALTVQLSGEVVPVALICVVVGFHSSKGVAVSPRLLILCLIIHGEVHVHLLGFWPHRLCPCCHDGSHRSHCCRSRCRLRRPMLWHPRCHECAQLFSGHCSQNLSLGSARCCQSPDDVDDEDVASSVPLLQLALSPGTATQSRANSGALRTTIDVGGLCWSGHWTSRPIRCPKCRTA